MRADMALHLSSSITALFGIGPVTLKDLKSLGIRTVKDLLFYFPFRYDDFSYSPKISALRHQDIATVVGTMSVIKARPSARRSLTIVEAIEEDESGPIKVVWFNQPYLVKTLRAGMKVSLAGRVDARFGRTLVNPVHEPAGSNFHTGRLIPVYGLTGSLSERKLRGLIRMVLLVAKECPEWLPEDLVVKESFPPLAEAIRQIHFPDSKEALDRAVNRLKFDELFLHQMMYADVRRQRAIRPAPAYPIDAIFLKEVVSRFPFQLTNAQRRAAWEIVKDCAKPHSMSRLLEGDVGSGKTVVAALASAHILHQGGCVAYLAPTEILALQQHAVFSKFLKDETIGLLTNKIVRFGNEEVKRSELFEAMKDGRVRCLIGTHALIQDGVPLPKLGFVIVDEQHRFGVEQRHALLDRQGEEAPHLLSMTATPIPRSLALTLYGDLDLSVLNECPRGRKPIATILVSPATRSSLPLESGGIQEAEMWQKVMVEIRAGHRVYVVCPLIDPSEEIEAKSVEELYRKLKVGPIKEAKIGKLHGRMKSDEKTEAINGLRSGTYDVLVSTTVVEVGVDVPEATVMVVVGAERFGLAQLHQLRGRVGRSDLPSFCYLLPEELTWPGKQRLSALVSCVDGFELAEKDLELRGAGNVFGNAQSGFPDFDLATPADVPLMKKARDWAARILDQDPDLSSHPLMRQRLQETYDAAHLE